MKKFLLNTLASITGTLIALFIVFLISISMIVALVSMASMSEKESSISKHTLLLLDLNGPIVERTSEDAFSMLMGNITGGKSAIGLNIILQNIKKAKTDPNIDGIYMESGMPQTGFATIDEIREALIDFKTSGKFIVSFSSTYTQKGYYLASVADSLYLNPSGYLEFKGLNSSRTFYKGTLDKLDIEVQVFKHGKFKSAVEPFIREEMSKEAKEQSIAYTSAIWSNILKNVSIARNVDINLLEEAANGMPMFSNPENLLNYKLIDAFKYKDEVLSELKEKTSTPEKDDLEAISISKYTSVLVKDENKVFSKDKIAIIYAEGEIDGANENEGIRSDKLSKTIRKARRDENIKAIVLRINSPGGSGLGSEIIWREVWLAKQAKPVIVSMGDLAASGGYYIACCADTIVAQPSTLTGSIGVFGMIPNLEGFYKMLGLTSDGVKTNKFADMPSVNRPFTEEEKDLMQNFIERFYDVFITRCSDGRSLPKQAIDEMGQGRVWSGTNAIENQLVDVLGGINTAIEIAKEKAGLDNYRIVELPEIEDPLTQFMNELTGNAQARFEQNFLGEEYKHLKTLKNIKGGDCIKARLPYLLELY